MSEASRKRRAKARVAENARMFSSWSEASLFDLLTAAACAPGAAHCGASIARTLAWVLHLRPDGREVIPASALANLLDTARQREPQLRSLQDYIPLDPKARVRVRHRGRQYRLHPAGLERPVAGIARMMRVAEATDATLGGLEGFGITDLMEVVLRYVDHAIEILSPHWATGVPETVDAPPHVSSAEVTAVQRLRPIQEIAAECTYPERADRALRWGTRDRDDVHFRPDGNTVLGTAIAVRLRPDILWPLPASFQIEALFAGAETLARRAAQHSASCGQKFRTASAVAAAKAVAKCISDTPPPAGLPTDDSRFSVLIPVASRHWLAVEVVSSLDHEGLQHLAERAARDLEVMRPGQDYVSGSGVPGGLPRDAEVARALVLSGAGHLGIMRGPARIARMSLDDLEWIAASHDDPDDLFLFVRDAADPPGVRSLLVFETINTWEVWRHNGKAFHRAGVPFIGMTLGAHEGNIEWTTFAERQDLEDALFDLGLPELRDWDIVTITKSRSRLFHHELGEAWLFSRGQRFMAVRLFDRLVPSVDRRILDNLGEALLWTIERTAPQLAAVLGAERYTILLEGIDAASDEPPLRLLDACQAHRFTIGWSKQLWDAEAAHPGTVERLLRDALLQGITAVTSTSPMSPSLEALQRAVIDAPPAFSMELETMHQRLVDLPKPQTPHASFLSSMQRSLAESIRSRDLQPGIFRGADAVRLESDVIYPFLKLGIHDRIKQFERDPLILTLACELECAAYWRAFRRKTLHSNIRNVQIEYDPVDEAMKLDWEDGAAERRLELLIELVLATPPNGRSSPDRIELRDLVSVSQMCIESGFRGEAAHYGVMPAETSISDLYEVVNTESGESSIDWASFHREGYEAMLAARKTEPRAAPETATVGSAGYSDIDQAMRTAYGFGAFSLGAALRALTTWPVAGARPVARAPLAQVVAFATPPDNASPEETRLAIEHLVLRGSDLRGQDIEPWEFAKRQARLLTRPLIECYGDNVLVLPWFLEKVLSIYIRYLSDGRLPWPRASTNPNVIAALERFRQARNSALEDDVSALVESHGLKTRKRVKKPHVLGLPSLHGEIDCIAVDEVRGKIWVLEVKDPEEVFSVADIARSIKRFYDPDAWLDKLAKKVEDVERAPANVVRALGARERDDWSVQGIVVTRRPVPAAHYREQRYRFTTLGCLTQVLSPR